MFYFRGFGQRPVLFLLGFVLAIFGAWSMGHAQQSPQTLQNHLPAAVANGQATSMGSLPPEQNMSFSIVLPLRNQSGLTSLLSQLYDPSSPNYHHFLSVAEFTAQFG